MADYTLACKYCGGGFNTPEALKQHAEAKHFAEIQAKPPYFDDGKKKQIKKYGIIAAVLIVMLGLGYMLVSAAAANKGIGPVGSTHTHMKVGVVIGGIPIAFSQSRETGAIIGVVT
ncbi:MAG: hypothetical protein AABX01_00665, partial [Candidatus Micrarchaeota archaeon]